MDDPTSHTSRLLDLLRTGDPDARTHLITYASERLQVLTQKMLREEYQRVKRWEQTDDVLNEALLRLYNALSEVTTDSPRFFWNLAAKHIRWQLLDMARRHFGPQGIGRNHHTDGEDQLKNLPHHSVKPTSPEEWALLYEEIERLPQEEREVFDLLWVDQLSQEGAAKVLLSSEGLTQREAAEKLRFSLETVKRRWQRAKRKLARALHGARK